MLYRLWACREACGRVILGRVLRMSMEDATAHQSTNVTNTKREQERCGVRACASPVDTGGAVHSGYRLGARRLRAGGRGLGHEDPGAVHVGGGAEARAGSHGLEGTDDETLGRGFRGGESWRPRPRGHGGRGALPRFTCPLPAPAHRTRRYTRRFEREREGEGTRGAGRGWETTPRSTACKGIVS